MNEDNFPNIFDEPNQNQNNSIPPQRKLERSKTDFVIAGVCSGLAKYMKIDAAIIRLIFLLLLLFGFWIVVVYLIASFLIPQEIEAQHFSREEKQKQRKVNIKTVAGGLLMLIGLRFTFASLGIYSSGSVLDFSFGFMVPFIAISAGAYFLGVKDNSEEHYAVYPNTFYRSRSDRFFMGVCGGFAKYINAEAYIVRVAFVFATLLTLGFFAAVYLLFSLTVKMETSEIVS
jgi:phage shock protein PspC (stress-responsive transcriptional regulator)